MMEPSELKKTRRGLGLTQGALAARLGVDIASISRWESGKQPIPKIAQKLIRVVGSLDYEEGVD